MFFIMIIRVVNFYGLHALQDGDPCLQGAKFKNWVRNFLKIEIIGGMEVLYSIKSNLPIIYKEILFQEIFQ